MSNIFLKFIYYYNIMDLMCVHMKIPSANKSFEYSNRG